MAGSSPGAIRAGKAFVELGVVDKLTAALNGWKGKLQAWAGGMAKVGAGLLGAGGVLAAPLTKLFKDAVSRGADIDALAKRFDLTAESVSGLAYAFERGGVGLDEFGGTLDGLNAKLLAAAGGGDSVFERLGLNARALIELPLDEQLEIIADRFTQIRLATDQAEVATELFGAAGTKMLPYLKHGAAGLRALAEEGRKAGAVLSAEDARQSADLMRAFTATWQALKYAVLEVGKALVPTAHDFKGVADCIRAGAATAREWVKENKGMILATAAVAAGLIAAGGAMLGLASAAAAAGKILGVVVLGIKAVAVAAGFLTTGVFGPLVGAIGLAGAAWLKWSDNGQAAAGHVAAGFRGMADTVKDTWGDVTEALKGGDLQGALSSAMSGLKLIWAKGIAALEKAWEDFKASTIGSWVATMLDGVKALGSLASDGTAAKKGGGGGPGGGEKGWAESSADATSNFLAKTGAGIVGTWKFLTEGREAAEQFSKTFREDMRGYAAQAAKDAEQRGRMMTDADKEVARLENEMLIARIRRRQEAAEKEKKAAAESAGRLGGDLGRMVAGVFGSLGKNGGPLPTYAQLAQAQKGTFSSYASAQTLGYGDNIGQRQLLATQETAKNTADAAAAARESAAETRKLREQLTVQ